MADVLEATRIRRLVSVSNHLTDPHLMQLVTAPAARPKSDRAGRGGREDHFTVAVTVKDSEDSVATPKSCKCLSIIFRAYFNSNSFTNT